jgi:hypothetical protein
MRGQLWKGPAVKEASRGRALSCAFGIWSESCQLIEEKFES